jgi:replicative DNA helicase
VSYLTQGREILEQAAVACLISDCQTATASGTMPEPELYGDLRVRTVCEAVVGMMARHEAVDVVTVMAELGKRKQLEAVGGPQFLSYLLNIKSMNCMFPEYQRRLWDFVDAADTERIVASLKEGLGEGDPLTAIMSATDQLQRQKKTTSLLTEARPLKDGLMRAIDRYEKLCAGQIKGIQTGFVPIDSQGGLQPSEMVLIAGHTGVGKSTLALNLLHAAVKSGEKAAVFSLEMSEQAWIDRLISLDIGIDRRTFRNRNMFTEAVTVKIASSMTRLKSLPIWICDDPNANLGLIRRVAARLAATAGVRLMVVDYAQLVAPGSEDSREQQVAAIGRGIRAICQEYQLVGLVLSQLNDDGRVRESRALLHEAHLALVLEERDGKLWVTSPKGREMHVPDFPVEFDALYCRLTQASQMPGCYEP